MKLTSADINKLPDHIRRQIEASQLPDAAAKNKYGANPTVVDGIKFHSAKEAKRYQQLKMLQTAGHIYNLQLQVRFELRKDEHLIETYYADFTYTVTETQLNIVEDVKGVRTSTYKRKKKWMKNIYGIEIKEI